MSSPQKDPNTDADLLKLKIAREKNAARQRKFKENNRLKKQAHWNVRNQIKRGHWVREKCAICGAFPAHAHHSDYSKPLDVDWLCKMHHEAWHRLFLAEGV